MRNDWLDYLYHYGTPRHSGRYPWGSGENPYHHSGRAGKLWDKGNKIYNKSLKSREKAAKYSSKYHKYESKAAKMERKKAKVLKPYVKGANITEDSMGRITNIKFNANQIKNPSKYLTQERVSDLIENYNKYSMKGRKYTEKAVIYSSKYHQYESKVAKADRKLSKIERKLQKYDR